jgi:hypothetical protein
MKENNGNKKEGTWSMATATAKQSQGKKTNPGKPKKTYNISTTKNRKEDISIALSVVESKEDDHT